MSRSSQFGFAPKRSLRTLLMALFILFSVAPLGFLTGFSFVKYEEAIRGELYQRLRGNAREVEIILGDFESTLTQSVTTLIEDPSLVFLMSSGNFLQIGTVARKIAPHQIARRLSFFDQDGRMVSSLFRGSDGRIEEEKRTKISEIFLPEKIVAQILEKSPFKLVDTVGVSLLELVIYAKIVNSNGKAVGFVEALVSMDELFLTGLKKRMNLELLLLDRESRPVVATMEDLTRFPQEYFRNLTQQDHEEVENILIQNHSLGLLVQPLTWGEDRFFVGLGGYTGESDRILKEVKYAFFTVVGTVVVLLSITSFVTSRIISRPFRLLLDAIASVEEGKPFKMIPEVSHTELGLLTESFNRMSQKTLKVQKELTDKINEAETAYSQLKEAQSQLVHSEKMASLGQLVAGVAHELNNPIGFIYSNMSHLREYSERLFHLIGVAKAEPQKLEEALEEAEYGYILEDLPKLIKSCEDGAQRIRDIVLGLRNFSRLDSSKISLIDITPGIEDTLTLLSGEIRGRIQIHREFESLPQVLCYPSQLNQVFMNILSNAIAAIEGQGDIWIKTRHLKESKKIEVRIRDNGKGIPPSEIGKIFDPFYTTKEIGEGTGLGLSISYGIVERHGGEIYVTSEVGKGSEFTVTLPLRALEIGKPGVIVQDRH